ncbi:unnamed protein product [Bodo saltans]|uniref:Succinate dehydrogenase assembly factor 3 n=1 Tax=Bodo saltans TaxID=75058 RepID=B6DTP2_BODSA|nr:hypothetical protein [Bodo saltans]CUG92415.1 unnamed protein product [Bodo saltans]|eukprot:CUG92415.1 unnamed protein product [Bodo saltans]
MRRFCASLAPHVPQKISLARPPTGQTSNSSGCGTQQRVAASPILQLLRRPQELGSQQCSFRSEEWRQSMLTLYRVILKLHAVRLEPVQRTFGDKFVKNEFRRHAMANEKYARIFYSSWVDYIVQLERGATSRSLTRDEESMLSAEQKGKLAEIRSYVVQQRQTDGDFTL